MKTLFLIGALLLAAGVAQAQDIKSVEVYEFGLYQRGNVIAELPPTPNGMGVAVSDGERHLRTTRQIPAQLGTSFGFRYRTEGKPGAVVSLAQVLLLPPAGLHSEISGKTITHDIFPTRTLIGTDNLMMMTFDHRWEMVPGIWTIQLWYGREKLAEESFEIFVPPNS